MGAGSWGSDFDFGRGDKGSAFGKEAEDGRERLLVSSLCSVHMARRGDHRLSQDAKIGGLELCEMV